jgi:hypothetical protein
MYVCMYVGGEWMMLGLFKRAPSLSVKPEGREE